MQQVPYSKILETLTRTDPAQDAFLIKEYCSNRSTFLAWDGENTYDNLFIERRNVTGSAFLSLYKNPVRGKLVTSISYDSWNASEENSRMELAIYLGMWVLLSGQEALEGKHILSELTKDQQDYCYSFAKELVLPKHEIRSMMEENGESYSDIKKRFGVPLSFVYDRLDEMGLL